MSFLRRWINRNKEMERIEDEFTTHSLDRLDLPISADQRVRNAFIRHLFRALQLCPSSDVEEKNVWRLDPTHLAVKMPECYGLFLYLVE